MSTLIDTKESRAFEITKDDAPRHAFACDGPHAGSWSWQTSNSRGSSIKGFWPNCPRVTACFANFARAACGRMAILRRSTISVVRWRGQPPDQRSE